MSSECLNALLLFVMLLKFISSVHHVHYEYNICVAVVFKRELLVTVAYPGILFGRGGQQIQLRTEDRENGDLGSGSPLVRGSGSSCNLVQEISFHMVKFS